MASKFTHRQDSGFSHTSICLKCFRVVGTRERESELRADEAVHSCKISLPGAKPDPTYWGILCRKCAELVAYGTAPPRSTGPGAEGSSPGTIRCIKGHIHIYFPRDFRLFPSVLAIAEATLQENLETFRAINPLWESSSDPPPPQPTVSISKEQFIVAMALNNTGGPLANLPPNPRREIANKAARDRWASWALKKKLRV
jgi:hypothetical protein